MLRNSLDVQYLPIDQIAPYPGHARRHTQTKIEKLKKLLRNFGQVLPILIDENHNIVGGHAVYQAMRSLEAGEIAVVVISGRSVSELRALRLALNRLGSEAVWDNDILRKELEALIEESFDLELTGFDVPEIDFILDVDLPDHNVVETKSDIPSVHTLAISRPGDIWQCGDHRVGCGDARDLAFVDCVRGSTLADACFVDPPYNVPIAGFVSRNERVHHREFKHASGEMSAEEFTHFLMSSLRVLKACSSQSAIIFACMDWRHIAELISAGRECPLQLVNLCVWAKNNAGMGSLYRSQHELIGVFKAGNQKHTNNVQLGRHGRNRSNLWQYRALTAFGPDRDEQLECHPTVKPVLMIADALRDVTKRGNVVLDTFLGSGSTLIAAVETGRICVGVELDPLYVDVAIRRWQAKTARDAVNVTTGEIFNERADRLSCAQEHPHAS